MDTSLASSNGVGVGVYPGPAVLTNGIFIGSDSSGFCQFRGEIDELSTHSFDMNADTLWGFWVLYSIFYGRFLQSAPFTPNSYDGATNIVGGPGYLQDLGASSACSTGGPPQITHLSRTRADNATSIIEFTVSGGTNGVPYDLFAAINLQGGGVTNTHFAWMGQTYSCRDYELTNQPNGYCWYVLGYPQDADQDGLTDAFELLVSKSDRHNADSDGDGLSDGEEILYSLDPNNQDTDGDGVIDQPFRVFITRPRDGNPLP